MEVTSMEVTADDNLVFMGTKWRKLKRAFIADDGLYVAEFWRVMLNSETLYRYEETTLVYLKQEDARRLIGAWTAGEDDGLSSC